MARRVGIAIVFALAVIGCDRWSENRVAETKRRGDIICQALEAYRAKTGNYPFELADLQPNFLRQIPQPTAGAKEWEYTVIDNGTNLLSPSARERVWPDPRQNPRSSSGIT